MTAARRTVAFGIPLFVVAALSLAACGTSGPGASSTTSSTTTTTLPVAVGVTATSPTGAFAGFGPVERVPVFALPAGVNTSPVGADGVAPTAGTVKIAFRQFGSGPSLLLAMGEHGSMTWWDPQLLTDLAASFRVTVFDYPNVGYSAVSAVAPTVEGYSDVMAGLVVALGLDHPVVVGWGLGGAAALALAERHPGLASGLALVDATAGGPTAPRPTKTVTRVLGSPVSTMEQLSRLLFPSAESAEAGAWLDRLAELPPDDVIASAVVAQARAQEEFFSDPTVEHSLGALRLPTLVITGSADQVVLPANSEVLAHRIRGARLSVLAGAGYAASSQDEPEFVHLLDSFAQKTFSTTTTTTVAP